MKPKKMVKSKMVAKGSGYGQDVLRKHNLVNDPSTGRFKAAGAKKKLVKLGTNAFNDIKTNTRTTRSQWKGILTRGGMYAAGSALVMGGLHIGLYGKSMRSFGIGALRGVRASAIGTAIGVGAVGGIEYAGRKLLRNRRKRK